jgi:phosphonoacetaldehyde hydrolase
MKITGVIFDWAGTLADHGSCGPVAALREIFTSAGVPITTAEARASMGLAKKTHIERILQLDRVREAWNSAHQRSPSSIDADHLYEAFIPRQVECLKDHADMIDGVPEAAVRLRGRGLKIGTTTGYTRPMLDILLTHARTQGFQPDFSACPEDVGEGRPAPFMCYLNAIHLATHPTWSMVKIGDTSADIEEGLNAEMWTIGITRTGNEVGLSRSEFDATSKEERRTRIASAEEKLLAAGAHYVAESAAECEHLLEKIEARLLAGERPWIR